MRETGVWLEADIMNKHRRSKYRSSPRGDKRLGLVILLGVVCLSTTVAVHVPAQAQELLLDENCTISILNRTAQVQPDGSWRIDNVPANFGAVRARATCVEGGVTLSGQSGLFDVEEGIVNISRFWQDNLIAPKTEIQGLKELEDISKITDQDAQTFTDNWVRSIPTRAWQNAFWQMIGVDVDPQSGSIGFGPGGSNLESRGGFALQRSGDRIAVAIHVTHVWSDDGYEFKKDKLFFEESQVLERHGKAKKFKWKAEWVEQVTGELEIINPLTPQATRRRIGFDALPLVDYISP